MTQTFAKPSLTIDEQIVHLRAKGMTIAEDAVAEYWLRHVSYYRLSAYWLYFEFPKGQAGPRFQPGTSFDKVTALYDFDRILRRLVMRGTEHVEVALRGSWAYQLAQLGDGHPFPLRIDDMDNLAAALDENIGLGLEQAPPILYCLQAEQPPALQMDTEAASSQRPAHHAADVLLEQGVHLEQQGKASLRTRRRGLEPVAKEELREGEQILPTGIGSVELDIFPAQRAHRNRGHIGVAERQFRYTHAEDTEIKVNQALNRGLLEAERKTGLKLRKEP